ncbi:licD family protein [Bifidobacterium dolichotidis]|uniref:LicD family protein n=1 Tax=Bifidobacterium dolichotidis TaxID=2306976 RepID=A0A430FSU0_9BIFI|nr:licD family protein [Bifidobacterium dolichotidis]
MKKHVSASNLCEKEYVQLSNDDLRIIHELQLQMAVEVRRICEKYGIRYTLCGGSLIGAVRHQGFIPWDDDMDIAMLAKDYERFLEIAPQELDQKFAIINYENSPEMVFVNTRVICRNTVIKNNAGARATAPHEVFIDIFPFDNMPDSKIKCFVHKAIEVIGRRIVYLKTGYPLNVSLYKRIIICLLSIFVPNERCAKKLYRWNQHRFDQNNSKSVVNLCGTYGYRKETVPRRWFSQFVPVQFEGETFSAIAEYDAWLKQVYGDYMALPPENQRVHSHFQPVEIDLTAFGGRKAEIE